MTKLRLIYASLLASLMAFPAAAQLSGNVSVEGDYQPLVIETERLNAFPQGYRFELPPANLDYEMEGVVTDFRPDLLTMGIRGGQADWPGAKRRGFVGFRMGSFLNTRLHAGVYALEDKANSLLAEVKFQSSSLYRQKGMPDTYTRFPMRRLYDGSVGLHYSHLVGAEGQLTASALYRLGYFNYYGTSIPLTSAKAGGLDAPFQTLNGVKASVGYSSGVSSIRGWHAEAAVDYLGYRRFFSPAASAQPAAGGDRETDLQLGGGYAFNFADNSAVALDANADFLFYSGYETLPQRHNYGVVALKPSYRFANGLLSMQAGVDVAVAYDAMGSQPGKKFGALHVAPDVSLAYRSSRGFGVSLSATGGVTPSTLRMREEFDRYQLPALLSTMPVYSPIDATAGFDFGPFAGFAARLSVRYAVARNTPLGGWYQVYLGTYLSPAFPFNEIDFLNPYMQGINLRGFEAALDLEYTFGTMVNLTFKGRYSPQSGKSGIFNGFDRPRWTIDAKAQVRPIKPLKLEIGYNYRGVRNCYAITSSAEGTALTGFRLPDITDLRARITYSILRNLDVYIYGENLLNCHPAILPGLLSEGIAVSAGLYFEF